MKWQTFKEIPNGTRVFNHGADECVALANLFQEDVLAESFVWVGSAKDWWLSYNLLPALYRTYRRSQKPVAGAVVVTKPNAANGWHGHIEVVLEVYRNGSYLTLGQNYGSGAARWAYRYVREHGDNVYGYLIPYKNPATVTPVPPAPKPPTPSPGQEEDEDMARFIGVYIGGDQTTPSEKRSCAIFEPTSGFYTTFSGVGQRYINEQARIFGTPNFTHVTKKHWDQTILPQLVVQQSKGRQKDLTVAVSGAVDVGPVEGVH